MAAVEPRYAEALLASSGNRQQAEEIGKAIEEVSNLMQTSSELNFFMLNPVVPNGAKKDVLKQIMPKDAPVFAQNFLMLLVDKGRLVKLASIIEEYNRKMAQKNGVLQIKVTSSVPLTQQELDEISETYRKKHGAERAQVDSIVNPALLGGIKVQIGDNLIDDSIYSRLRALATAIKQ